jgi:hypothetical protein
MHTQYLMSVDESSEYYQAKKKMLAQERRERRERRRLRWSVTCLIGCVFTAPLPTYTTIHTA